MVLMWVLVIIVLFLFGFVVFWGAPYVPSLKPSLRQAFNELYRLSSNDVLVDIGSGGGVVLREASKLGAKAIGYEINPILVFISRLLARGDGHINVRLVDFWSTQLPMDVTVVYVFSVQRDMNKISNWVQNEANRLKKSIYLISFGFEIIDVKSIKDIGAYHLYVFHSLQYSEAQV